MNNKLKHYITVLFLALGAIACKKETTRVEPDVAPEYIFPQGNNPFDAELVNWQKKYNTYFIYQFTNEDFNRFTEDSRLGYKLKIVGTPGDPQRMGAYVQLLREEWLKHYPDSILAVMLPYKVFVAASISDTSTKIAQPFLPQYKSFGISGASAQMDTLSSAGRKKFRTTINQNFLSWLPTVGKLTIPADFYKNSSYTVTLTEANKFSEGFLTAHTKKDADRMKLDLADFLTLALTYSPQWLEANRFTPQVDTKGKLKAKYKLLVDYIKATCKIDLGTMASS